MNILFEELPAAVVIDGQEYDVNTNFRTWLRVITAFEDPELADVERQAILLQNIYPIQPENTQVAIEMGIRFLNGGNPEKEEGTPARLFSFTKDANLIFSAFRQTHGIDLTATKYLHWWAFLALFMDLGSETAFCSLVNLRRRLQSGEATKEERKQAHDMGDWVNVPESNWQTPEEKEMEAEFERLLEEGQRAKEGK